MQPTLAPTLMGASSPYGEVTGRDYVPYNSGTALVDMVSKDKDAASLTCSLQKHVSILLPVVSGFEGACLGQACHDDNVKHCQGLNAPTCLRSLPATLQTVAAVDPNTRRLLQTNVLMATSGVPGFTNITATRWVA